MSSTDSESALLAHEKIEDDQLCSISKASCDNIGRGAFRLVEMRRETE